MLVDETEITIRMKTFNSDYYLDLVNWEDRKFDARNMKIQWTVNIPFKSVICLDVSFPLFLVCFVTCSCKTSNFIQKHISFSRFKHFFLLPLVVVVRDLSRLPSRWRLIGTDKESVGQQYFDVTWLQGNVSFQDHGAWAFSFSFAHIIVEMETTKRMVVQNGFFTAWSLFV